MRKQEFLDILGKKLSGDLSSYDIADNIRYYDDYISDKVREGRGEEEVIEEIGSPLLVAKTIIDTHGGTSGPSKQKNRNSSYNDQYTNNSNTDSTGFNVKYDERGWDVRYRETKLNTWYWKLLAIVIVVVVALIIFKIVGSIISLLFPLLFPIVIILLVISIFGGRRR